MVYIIPNCDMFQFNRNHFQVVQIIKITVTYTEHIQEYNHISTQCQIIQQMWRETMTSIQRKLAKVQYYNTISAAALTLTRKCWWYFVFSDFYDSKWTNWNDLQTTLFSWLR